MRSLVVSMTLLALVAGGCRAFDNDSPPVRSRYQGDTTSEGGGDTDLPSASLTIYDIQNEKRPDHPAENTVVELTGVIVSAVVSTEDGIDFCVAESAGGDYSGIYVRDSDGLTPDAIQLGDAVDLVASYDEYYDFSRLTLANASGGQVIITSKGNAVPMEIVPAADIDTIATGGARAEAFEGALVEVDGTVTVAELLTHGEFNVENSAGETLMLNDLLWEDADVGRTVGQEITLLRGILNYSFSNFKLEPRDAGDLQTTAVSSTVVTIYEIQDESKANHPAEGTLVEVHDVVVTAVQGGSAPEVFFVAEAAGGDFSSIFIDDRDALAPGDLAVGDAVTVVGVYGEYYGRSQVVVASGVGSVTRSSRGNAVPVEWVPAADIDTIATGGARAEALEGTLIEIEGALSVAGLLDHGELTIQNASDETLRVDDLLWSDAEVGRTVDEMIDLLRGPLDYSYGNFKLLPRDADDLSGPPLVSIYEIQDRNHQTPVPVGAYVRLEGVVVTAVEGGGTGSFFVQIPDGEQHPDYGATYSGIYCHRADDAANFKIAPDRIFNVDGVYVEVPDGHLNALSQIEVMSVEYVEVGISPTPAVVLAAEVGTGSFLAETYEGVLVQIDDTAVLDPFPAAPADEGRVLLEDNLVVVDTLFADTSIALRQDTAGIAYVRGVLHYADEEHHLLVRAAADISLNASSEPEVEIYQIQKRDHPITVPLGETLGLARVVVTGVVGAGDAGFFVQIPEADYDGTYGSTFSGVYIARSAGATPAVSVGDLLLIQGQYVENGENSELIPSLIQLLATTTPVPAPTVVTPANVTTGGGEAETYQGVLVEVQAVTVTLLNPDGPGDDFGEFAITDGLRVDDLLYAGAPADGRANTTGYASIVGLLYFESTHTKLEPRDAADLTAN